MFSGQIVFLGVFVSSAFSLFEHILTSGFSFKSMHFNNFWHFDWIDQREGSNVVQWLAPSAHRNQVLGSNMPVAWGPVAITGTPYDSIVIFVMCLAI